MLRRAASKGPEPRNAKRARRGAAKEEEMTTNKFIKPRVLAASLLAGSALLFTGCAGVTTLRCGVDADSSFVELVNMPQDISSQSRYFSELCGFSYVQEK